jgi:hypothetical protein
MLEQQLDIVGAVVASTKFQQKFPGLDLQGESVYRVYSSGAGRQVRILAVGIAEIREFGKFFIVGWPMTGSRKKGTGRFHAAHTRNESSLPAPFHMSAVIRASQRP